MKFPFFLFLFSAGFFFTAAHGPAEQKSDRKPFQYRLRQLLIEPAPTSEHDGEVLAKTHECLQRAKTGEDFSGLARKYSQEPGADRTGGDLGFFTADRMLKSFSDAVFTMKPGEIRGPVKTQYGYHIIKLLEIRGTRRHAQHILFTLIPSRADSIAAMKTMRNIYKELDDGADFSDMFEKNNINEELRRTEGYMVWQKTEEMLEEFQKAVVGLKPGDFSQPFSSILGYHIVTVDSINYDSGVTLQGFPARIERKLREENREDRSGP